jgi:hypothetical protein
MTHSVPFLLAPPKQAHPTIHHLLQRYRRLWNYHTKLVVVKNYEPHALREMILSPTLHHLLVIVHHSKYYFDTVGVCCQSSQYRGFKQFNQPRGPQV